MFIKAGKFSHFSSYLKDNSEKSFYFCGQTIYHNELLQIRIKNHSQYGNP
jgi:hypothetical protein